MQSYHRIYWWALSHPIKKNSFTTNKLFTLKKQQPNHGRNGHARLRQGEGRAAARRNAETEEALKTTEEIKKKL